MGLLPRDKFVEIQKDAADSDPRPHLRGFLPLDNAGREKLAGCAGITVQNLLLPAVVFCEAFSLRRSWRAPEADPEAVGAPVRHTPSFFPQETGGQALRSLKEYRVVQKIERLQR